ncbi:Histidinol phosphate aminotransferase [Gammaproteobacteria bacterium]
MIQVKTNLNSIHAYTTPWAGLDRSQYLRLDLNESTQPIPDQAIARMMKFISQVGVQCYPEYQGFIKKLSSYCGVAENWLLATNGSDQGIDIVLRAFLSPGDEMVIARPEFAMFGNIAQLLEARIAGVPYTTEFLFPYEKFHEGISQATRLIVIINPNNPTGTIVSLEYIEWLLQRFPNLPILVDEAYYEYTGSTAMEFMRRHDNLIILRTFSKAFAMAGLRLGYVMARPELITHFEKIRGPFAVNSLAVEAATVQIEYLEKMRAHVDEIMKIAKPFTKKFLAAHNIKFFDGAANFLLITMPNINDMVEHLKSNRILVRPLHGTGLDGLIRMGIGTLDEMRLVEKAIASFHNSTLKFCKNSLGC